MILGMNYTLGNKIANYKKITISIPDHLYRQVQKMAKPGEVSKFFSEAISTKVSSVVSAKNTDPVEEFLALRDQLPKFSYKEIKEAIRAGRK